MKEIARVSGHRIGRQVRRVKPSFSLCRMAVIILRRQGFGRIRVDEPSEPFDQWMMTSIRTADMVKMTIT